MSTNSRRISFLKIGKIFQSKALSILEILNVLYSFLPLTDLLLEKLIETERFNFLFLVQKFYKNCSIATSFKTLRSFLLQWPVVADEFYLLFGNVFFARHLLQNQENKSMNACFRFILKGFQEKQKSVWN